MSLSRTISLPQPLRDVRRLTAALPQDWAELLRQHEQTATVRGHAEGERALSEQLVRQRTEMSQLQQGILNSLSHAVPQVIQEAEDALLQLALGAARKVVAGLPITSELIEAVVREALQQVEDTAEIVIQLHPDDLALLRQHDSALLEGAPETGPLRFVSSAEITRGGCLVQTRFGVIDALRETKFKQLEQSLNPAT